MKFRHLALISIIAAFSLLAFVFANWMKPFNVQATKQISHSEQLFCSVPTSASVYIAEVKPNLACLGTTAFVCAKALLLTQPKSVGLFDHRKVAVENCPRPLWLLNRSILI
ncbi:MAG: hypothetical protein DKT66_06110 [Candidatus Melainabacteria bacterium]|nr:MAG: hypothetical protein DKT66_06110 [Candidatus Melainabacteria bacterium]